MTETFPTSLLAGIPTALLISYALFTFLLTYFWKKIPATPNSAPPYMTKISVIIPVRNEVNNIENLLHDLQNQTLPKHQFEVLVVDDSSTDGTAELALSLATLLTCNIRLIKLSDSQTTSPKKRAIETAMLEATGELIITTDGDCRVKPKWLEAFVDCYRNTNAQLISGPVTFTTETTLADHLQTVEFASLIGSGASAISAGFPSLCNGANLAYEKKVFYEVNGFEGVKHIASGDDEFLMHKIAALYPTGIQFLKNQDAIVSTSPHKSWYMFFRQRKRWASKWKHYQSSTPLVLALYVFMCNLSLIVAFVLYVSGIIKGSEFLLLALVKCGPEWLFLSSILAFLDKKRSILFIPVTQIVYPFYVCFFGLAVQKPKYEWKGRKLV
jgi:cellulose synthase/poly-beta-1,6-N-acetylglucosamine synthase-like glycosyltransferase